MFIEYQKGFLMGQILIYIWREVLKSNQMIGKLILGILEHMEIFQQLLMGRHLSSLCRYLLHNCCRA